MRACYSADPSVRDQSGDIWLGMVPAYRCWQGKSSAILITPACDLAQNKCEWVTFVPAIPIKSWLSSRGFFRDILTQLKEACSKVNIVLPIELDSMAITTMHEVALKNVMNKLKQLAGKKGLEVHLNRANSAAKVLLAQLGFSEECAQNDLKQCFTSGNFLRVLKAIAGNAYRSDIHFLPSDGRSPPHSVMEADSVALFRYLFSVPIEILVAASDTKNSNWLESMSTIRKSFPSITLPELDRPMKIGSLNKVYQSDLISRFVANQIRLGVPDFPTSYHDDVAQRILGDGV